MKKPLPILLLLLWLLFNYSRIWTYQLCPAKPVIALPTVICDCERQSPQAIAGDNGLPGAERSVAKQKPEEVFAGGILFTLPGYFAGDVSIESLFIGHRVLSGFPTLFIQPPRC